MPFAVMSSWNYSMQMLSSDSSHSLPSWFQGHVDSTWVFMAWEGILAKHKGVDLNAFSLSDFKVPYGYSPVLLAAPASLR